LKKEISISTFISCFDIEAVGEGQIDKVLTAIPKADLNFFLHPGSSKQFICEGISDILADKIYYGMVENVEEIEKCMSFFNVKSNESKEEKVEGKLSGLSFCFTGAMSIKRSDLEKMVVENGGEVKAVSKGLSFLVQQDPNSTSTKSEKAKKLGTKIISPEEFLNMLK
jgi:DNA ligase (NAD+)